MHLISPVLRDYAWGTHDDIPLLLGVTPPGGPVAEAWWGAHTSAPSPSTLAGGEPLDERIAQDPESTLGHEAAKRWGARLPYLLKVLAIDKPLSIQVHPTLAQARHGFALEQRGTGGLPHAFVDPYHKPEMVVAVTEMRVLAGVREVVDTAADLRSLGTGRAQGLAEALEQAGDVRDFIRGALSGGVDDETLAALADLGSRADAESSMAAAARALAHFPGDAGAIVALAMHAVRLRPGDALFVGAGVLHSYQSGMGLEIMANSDNVVRAGLTPKNVNVPLLLKLLDPKPSEPQAPVVKTAGAARHLVTTSEEFALTLVNDGSVSLPTAPRIVLCFRGTATLTAAGRTLELRRGQAAFVPFEDGELTVAADGGAVIARTPSDGERVLTHPH
ncbi:mannose-6-phosphate isomerase, class I [Demequina globuliformis]|uniref:mannose-6-phosphate isomerase, class I n=1 Tax=Demequina globuliformis TaxID=676202 RepID=UPI00078022A0|nr:mannose-6-phosphate isomerase, class I [Demequina globuliformis]